LQKKGANEKKEDKKGEVGKKKSIRRGSKDQNQGLYRKRNWTVRKPKPAKNFSKKKDGRDSAKAKIRDVGESMLGQDWCEVRR